MAKVVISLVVAIAVGFLAGYSLHNPEILNVQKAVNSGGLTIEK